MATKTGTAAANVLNSTAIADRLLGLGGNDTLNGGGGNDTLEGGSGNDRLVGGTGNDVYIFATGGGTDTIVEAPGLAGGSDTLRSAVTVNALANNVENLVLTGIGIIHGTGNTGHNRITGNTKNNRLSGANGNDTLDGGAGNDTTTGGAGNDVHIVAQAGDKVVDSTGVDTVRSSVTFTLGANVEHLTLTGTGNINGTGNTLANTLTGNTKNNTLSGSGGVDKLDGGTGNDSLNGGAGAADTLLGGAGNDILIWDAADAVRDGGANTDTLRVMAGAVNLASEPIANMEIVDLAGTNTLNLTAAIIVAGNAFTSDTLTVNGGAGDAVVAGSGWTQVAGPAGYAQYTKDGATLRVDLDIDRSGIGVAELHLSALDGMNGFRLNGVEQDDSPTFAGAAVASAGDINGDGYDDFIVGAMLGNYGTGSAYVVFGGPGGFDPTIEASALDGTNGFVLGTPPGPPPFPVGIGYSVASAGDINGDGLADIVIGAPAGLAIVVFGATSFASFLNLNEPSDAYFTIQGPGGFPFDPSGFGVSVGSAGDVNGDGYGDIIVGAPEEYGAAYVIYGASSFATSLSASELDGTNGFVLEGVNPGDATGASVSAAGDVNGDGYGDLIIGADQCGCDGPEGTGIAYVVFGGPDVAAVDLGALDGENGFLLAGIAVGDLTGTSVSAAGDVNGDGIADLIVGAPEVNSEAGAAYVVFGGQDFGAVLELSALDGTTGFRLAGAPDDYAGISVASAGDVNGDGYDDLIVGAPVEYSEALNSPGRAYIVFGSSAFGSILDLSSLDGPNGFQLLGVEDGDSAGVSVASAGDVDGDGFADVIIGANYAYSGDSDFAVGEAFVVFGRDFNNVVDFLGGAGNDTFTGGAGAEAFVGGRGDDLLIGGGGNDAFHGGEGDDRIVLGSGEPVRVDGGTGDDTLALDGGLALDLAQVPDARIAGIEIIDLVAGAGASELTLTARGILALSGSSNTLVVNGDGNDTVHAGNGWTLADESGGYEEYTKGGATLRVDQDVILDIGLVVSSLALSTLNGANGFRLDGAQFSDSSGQSVASAGDVNGDGFDDVIIGAYTADPDLVSNAGASYVVFGKEGGFDSALSLSSLNGTNGFRLDGAGMNDLSGGSVASAGDVDGDGLDDMIVGALGAASSAGASYVVFGESTFASSVYLSALDGTIGFRLDGIDAGDRSGGAVASAGDVNADGIADLVVGAYFANGQEGETYVVFGMDGGFSSAIGLGTLDGNTGFRLDGIGRSGASVASAGDLNGDGIGDLVIGAYFADTVAGETYVVFGRASGFGSALSLTGLDGATGFRLDGEGSGEFSGFSVASAGDINGDGRADLIIGAMGADLNGVNSGASYVVFGREDGFESALSLSGLDGTNGFRLGGPGAGTYSGMSVASAGDVNGDGYDDLIIGGPESDEAYVVFGHGGGHAPELNLSTLNGMNGFRLDGATSTGYSVSSAGDVNGDGYADVIVGAREANSGSGESYVVFGRDFRGDTDFEGGNGNDMLIGGRRAEVFVGGRGDDTMIGGGGDDAFHGGEGNDRIVLGVGDPLRVDGGSGMDTVAVDGFGASITLDGTDASVQSIEKVDLGGTHANTLVLTRAGVLAASGTTNILRVIGDEDGDAVTLLGDWQLGPLPGEVYDYWYSGNAQVWIEQGLTVHTGSMSLSALDGDNGFRLDGATSMDRAGISVAAAGDINGDGFGDFIVGADLADPNGLDAAGESYVVFGDAAGYGSALNPGALDGTNGFQLNGIGVSDRSGYSVSSAGDVNGDGHADLLIGALGAANGQGVTYVVFGHSGSYASFFDLSSLDGTAGFRLDGASLGDRAGNSAASAGDVNGDGYSDIIIGAPTTSYAGMSYVVFGHSGSYVPVLELTALDGTTGFRMDGIDAGNRTGWSVASAGDFNGDGYDDVIVGAPQSDNGEAYVVFGKAGSFDSSLDLSALDGTSGFRLAGIEPDDYAGISVASAGDFNGDGLSDLLIGAYGAAGGGHTNSGQTYLVFGQSSPGASSLDLSALDGTTGFRFDGIVVGDHSGKSAASAGDFNGDGYDDIIIGARLADPGGHNSAGETYVVFGGADGFGSAFELATLDAGRGFRLDGVATYDRAGMSVASAGDVNGDGYDDLVVGAYMPVVGPGAGYIVYGGNRNGAVSFAGGDGDDALTGSGDDEAFVGGRGNDTMTGGGGLDAFSGGEGDDRIVVATDGFLDVDGGSGEDTLVLGASGADLDLNQPGFTTSRVGGIEIIDLVAGGGSSTLVLSFSDVLGISDTSNTLTVNGGDGDVVDVTGVSWGSANTVGDYHVYEQDAAILRVQVGIDVSGIETIF